MSLIGEDVLLSNKAFFKTKISGPLPKPPIFKNGFSGKQFTVPKYYPYNHSETQWILNMYKSENWERLEKIAIINPTYYRISYFQVPDNPEHGNGKPMFHDRVILYLTPLALGIYLNSATIVKNLIRLKSKCDEQLIDIFQPCYITNLYVKSKDKINDLMQIYPFCILVLREAFDCIEPMLTKTSWSPLKEFSLLYRRPFKICKFSFKDILDYCLSQMITKTSLRFPQFLNELIICLDEEFSLLYFEQIIVNYKCWEIEEWVSIPRRLLRFAFYFDKDMRITCQIVRCVKIFQQHCFFCGPTNSCFEISYNYRLFIISRNFNYKCCTTDISRVINDQDNCIALLLTLLEHAQTFHHHIIVDKILNVLPSILNDTHWLLHFICKKPKELSKYFSNLIEKVGGEISDIVFSMTKDVIIRHLRSGVVPIYGIKELNIRQNYEIYIDDILNSFAQENSKYLGFNEYDLKYCYGQDIDSLTNVNDTDEIKFISSAEQLEVSSSQSLNSIIVEHQNNETDEDCGEESENSNIISSVLQILQNDVENC